MKRSVMLATALFLALSCAAYADFCPYPELKKAV